MHRSDFEVLQIPNLRRFFIARALTVVNGSIAPIAMAFAILDLPGGDSQDLALVEVCVVIPQLTAILIGGVLADRWSRVRTLVLGGSTASVGMFLLGIMLSMHVSHVGAYCIGAALTGLGSGLGFPVFTALIADTVPEQQRQSANGLFRLVINLSRVGGAGIAGLMIVTLGNAGTMFIVGSGFVASALIVSGIKVHQLPGSGESAIKDLTNGWKEFISYPWVVIIVVCYMIMNSMYAGTIDVIGPVIAKSDLGGAKGWALIAMCGSLGALVGTVIALRLKYRRPLITASLSSFAFPIFIMLFSFPAPLYVLAIGAALAGISMDIFGVAWDGALQREVAREKLSRVSSYDWFGSMVAIPVGIIFAGWGAKHFGPSTILPWMALVAALSLIPPFLSRSVWNVKGPQVE